MFTQMKKSGFFFFASRFITLSSTCTNNKCKNQKQTKNTNDNLFLILNIISPNISLLNTEVTEDQREISKLVLTAVKITYCPIKFDCPASFKFI